MIYIITVHTKKNRYETCISRKAKYKKAYASFITVKKHYKL